jgi:hypothetical protein
VTTTPRPPTTAPTTTVPQQVAPLTGVEGHFGDRITHPAVFVKIDNAPQARPHAGLIHADIVFEERVEGNITRLAAVFHSTDAPEIGPVRSTRSTDLLLAPMFGRPLFASSGGNASILGLLHRANVIDVGHNVSGQGFRRVSGRRAPHNLFTSLQELYNKAPEQPAAPKPVFEYRAAGEPLPAGARPAAGVALSFGGAQISRFAWDAPSKLWHRYHGNERHLDVTGAPVAPANVVVMEIAYEFSAATGNSRPHGVTEGEGRALVFTAGNVIEGRWVRPNRQAGIRLVTADGTPIKLTPGQTFVELPPPGGVAVL